MLSKKKEDKKEKIAKGTVETILGEGTSIEGDLRTKGSLRLEGEFKGNIKAVGDIFVGKKGKLETKIKARKVSLAGIVHGDIIATEKIEILSSGKLYGNIQAPSLKIEEGAVFSGLSKVLSAEEKSLEKKVEDKQQSTE